jgi:acyl carrier protein
VETEITRACARVDSRGFAQQESSSVRRCSTEIDGWDSLKGVRLVLRLEEIVGRELSESDIEKLQSVDDVDRLLKAA